MVDDAFAARGCKSDIATTLAAAREEIAELGDEVVEAVLMPRRDVERMNAVLLGRLVTGAAAVGRSHRELAPALREFLREFRRGSRVLAGGVRPGLLVVRRGG